MARTWNTRPDRLLKTDPRNTRNGRYAGVDQDGEPLVRALFTGERGRGFYQRAAHKRDRAALRQSLHSHTEPPRASRRGVTCAKH